MPIVVECACGKKLRAPDSSAGKRAKCPACQAVVTLPPPPERTDDLYELAEDPFEPAAPRPAPRPAAPVAQPTPRPTPRQAPQSLMDSPFWQASAQRVIQRDAAATKGPRPLFNAFGIEVTRMKLSVAVAAVVAILALPVWWLKFGPGADVKLLSAQTVEAVPLLGGLATREPYSLFTGTGDRSLGLKGPKLKNPPPGAATVDIVFSMGGGEQLFLTRPDPNGRHLLLQAHVSHGLMNRLGRQSSYEYRVSANDFSLEPLDGGDPLKPTMLYAEFDGSVEIDIAGANAVGYEALLPVGVRPSSQELQRAHGGVAQGTIVYDGSSGASGQFDFSSPYFMSGAPGVSGLFANGRVTRTMPDGSQVDYAYNGGTIDISWAQGGRRGGPRGSSPTPTA